MARYTGPRCRLSRREGVNLGLKKRWSLDKREAPPGQHGFRRGKLSNYGLQLREKQKAKRIYGILEKQFKNYYLKATAAKGVTGTVLLQYLETRLDNVVYRLGFAITRAQARQIVSHGLVRVNGRKVNIASAPVKVGDEISFSVKDATTKYLKKNLDLNDGWAVPAWLQADSAAFKGKVIRIPSREDISLPVNEQLIIELYSK
ncbi:MAG: 30S ribosomal protein S4 [Candidatus Omnitrophica bacterium]|nr:30S ribosomal protein S4 [Candidatus Omnitrophota bacterium]